MIKKGFYDSQLDEALLTVNSYKKQALRNSA